MQHFDKFIMLVTLFFCLKMSNIIAINITNAHLTCPTSASHCKWAGHYSLWSGIHPPGVFQSGNQRLVVKTLDNIRPMEILFFSRPIPPSLLQKYR